MSIEKEDLDKFISAVRSLDGTIQKFNASTSPNNKAEIHINAGGVGLWIAVMCCLTMLIVMFFGGIAYLNMSDKVEKTQDYLNAIYMQAPQLKPKEDKK